MSGTEYEKIQTIFKRDPENNHKTLLMGEFSRPEFEFLADREWIFTEKVDGTNLRFVYDKGKVSYHGRTNRAQIPPRLVQVLDQTAEDQIERLHELFGQEGKEKHVVFYGEGYGASIQKGGGKYRDDQGFVVFDICVNGVYLDRSNVEDICGQLGLEIVPEIGRGSLYEAVLKAQVGFSSCWGDFQAEGLVARPSVELRDRFGERIITKIKCSDFES